MGEGRKERKREKRERRLFKDFTHKLPVEAIRSRLIGTIRRGPYAQTIAIGAPREYRGAILDEKSAQPSSTTGSHSLRIEPVTYRRGAIARIAAVIRVPALCGRGENDDEGAGRAEGVDAVFLHGGAGAGEAPGADGFLREGRVRWVDGGFYRRGVGRTLL